MGISDCGIANEHVGVAAVVAVVSAAVAGVGCDAHSGASERSGGERSGQAAPPEASERDESTDIDRGSDTGKSDSSDAERVNSNGRDAGRAGPTGPCGSGGLHGELQLDLDGDGRSDTVSVDTSTFDGGARRILRVSLASGEDDRLGAPGSPSVTRRIYREAGGSEYRGDFGFACSWGVRESEHGMISGQPPVPGARGYEIKDALGDGLYLSGTDGAAILYLSEPGWVLMELGY